MDTEQLRQQVRDRISLGNLSRLGCSRDILFQGVMRYIVCEAQAGELRVAFAQAGITKDQLESQARAARTLAGFLKRLQDNSRIVAANDPPQIGPGGSMPIPVLCEDLLKTAEWLENIVPFRPDSTEALVGLVLYLERKTGERRLPDIAELLNAALEAARLRDSVTDESLKKRFDRADDTIRKKAEDLLASWESLS